MMQEGCEERMHHMPAGEHSALQTCRAAEVYAEQCGYLLKRSGGKRSNMSPKGMSKAFSFGQLAKHWDVRFFQIVGTDLVWGVERQDFVDEVGLKRFDLSGCRVELRSEEKASAKGYRPRFKLVHPNRTLTFEVPSNGVPFPEITAAVAAWSEVLMAAIKKADRRAEGAALRAGQPKSPAEAAALAERLMSQYDIDQFAVDEDDDDFGAGEARSGGGGPPPSTTAVFEGAGALGLTLGAEEIGSDELPPGWTEEQEADGRTVYVMPRGQGKQYKRPNSHEHQSAVIQSIAAGGLVATGQYREKNSSRVDFLRAGMVLDAVNGDSVIGVPFKRVLNRIKTAGRPVELTFHMPIAGQAEMFSPRNEERPSPTLAGLFNRRVESNGETDRAESSSPSKSLSSPPPRRVRASTAGPADYDDPKDEAAVASDDDDYVDAATELQSFRSLQGSAELLDKEIAMIHVDMASTPRNRQRSPRHGQGTSSRDATAASSPYHGRRGEEDGLMRRLQSLYAQHEAEFETERAMRLAQIGDPTALTPTQQLLKERNERSAEKAELEAEVQALKAALRAAQPPQG